jgi:pimeloyl-ACP methyl ester carboxylesterase
VIVALLSVASNRSSAADFSTTTTALTGHIIKLKTGVTLEYVTQGREDGQPIILLHGGGDSWHSWLRVLPLIPEQYHVYAITLRGHGLSGRRPVMPASTSRTTLSPSSISCTSRSRSLPGIPWEPWSRRRSP